ncbi:MAG: hypothetical protein ACHQK9_12885 [Reyranellales bacterium]
MARQTVPGDSVGIQVPVGRIRANRTRWQTVFDARDKPMVYRLYNAPPRGRGEAGNSLVVDVDGTASRQIHVAVGASVDVLAKKIRVKAATGGSTDIAEGWYVLVS